MKENVQNSSGIDVTHGSSYGQREGVETDEIEIISSICEKEAICMEL